MSLKTYDSWKFIDATGGGFFRTFTGDNIFIDTPGIEGVDRGNPKQLFELPVDIGEFNNLIASSGNDTLISIASTAITGRDLLGMLNNLRTTESTSMYPRAPDNDADGMPNAFELANGLDPDWPLDAASDLDGDGLSNLDEFIVGTDPNDANDPEPVLLGDANLNGVVNFLDIPAFIAVLQSGVFLAQADCDQNGVVNFLDIPAFIAILQGE